MEYYNTDIQKAIEADLLEGENVTESSDVLVCNVYCISLLYYCIVTCEGYIALSSLKCPRDCILYTGCISTGKGMGNILMW